MTADIDNMYMNMPLELSEQGIREYFDKQDRDNKDINTDDVIEGLELCQENNILSLRINCTNKKLATQLDRSKHHLWLAVGRG